MKELFNIVPVTKTETSCNVFSKKCQGLFTDIGGEPYVNCLHKPPPPSKKTCLSKKYRIINTKLKVNLNKQTIIFIIINFNSSGENCNVSIKEIKTKIVTHTDCCTIEIKLPHWIGNYVMKNLDLLDIMIMIMMKICLKKKHHNTTMKFQVLFKTYCCHP